MAQNGRGVIDIYRSFIDNHLMKDNNVSLPSFYIRQIIDLVGQRGIQENTWLPEVGLDISELDKNTITLPWCTFRQLIVQACKLTHEPALGLLIGEKLLVNTHGILGYAAISATTIREAVILFQRFMPLRTGLVSLQYEENNGLFRVSFIETRLLEDIRRPILEAVVLAIKNVLDFITMGNSGILHVAFSFDVQDQRLAQSLIRSEVLYGQNWTGFSLPIKLADRPLKMANSASFNEALRICETELEKLTNQTTLSGKVRRLMLESYCHFPSLDSTAQRFHMTSRTLHRHLIEEGTSYKQILEEVRQLLAIKYLEGGQMSIQEIAYALGYSDIANFRRAFKRWEGVAPSQYIQD